MSIQIFLLVMSVITHLAVSAQRSTLTADIDSPACQAWVDSTYSTMTEAERIGQLMMVNLAPGQGQTSKTNIRTEVEKYHVGGIYFSKGTIAQFAEMTNYAQEIADVPLLVGIDGEWGPSMRVDGAPVFPKNMVLGAIRNSDLLFEYGEEVARECRALGIQVDFAPVLDVNSNPDNPVIGTRSYGEDPHRVAALGKAFSLGLESGGVMAVAKHFPGHGDTNTDSHKALPTISHSLKTLETVDFVPFKAYIDAGLGGIMVAHLSVPALDKAGVPSSLSRKTVNDLLREKMRFNGLIFTDALQMKGAVSAGNACVEALKAGADVLLSPVNPPSDITAISNAVRDGVLPKGIIEEKCKKILAYKYVLGAWRRPKVNTATVAAELHSPQAASLITRLADAAITVVRNECGILPVGNLGENDIAVVNIGAPADNDFTAMCRRYAAIDAYSASGSTIGATELAQIKKHDTVIAAVYNDSKTSQAVMAQLKDVRGLVAVFFTSPYKMSAFKTSIAGAPALVAAYDNTAALREAAAKAIFGGIEVDGRMPVNVQGVASLGEGVDIEKTRLGFAPPSAQGVSDNLTARIDSVMNAAVKAGAFPGAQVVVAKGGDIIVDKAYGTVTSGGAPVTEETVYDLASVSKAIGTLPGVMKAYEQGLFGLDNPVGKYIAEMNTPGKDDITPRMLLYHESGMPAAIDTYSLMLDPDTYTGRAVTAKRDAAHTVESPGVGWGSKSARLRTDILSTKPTGETDVEIAKGIYAGPAAFDTVMARIYSRDVKPSRPSLYSCLNFAILMDMEQRLTGRPHDEWVEETVWDPIGAGSLTYLPRDKYELSQIAATEYDPLLRRQHVHGYVHDELAAFSGGVQGNAGVFGNATDVAKVCQMWLNGGRYGDAQVLSPEVTRLFTTDKSSKSHRGLGFDKPDKSKDRNVSLSSRASAGTYGHTGFSGTCFWVDPESDLIYVFLSNRIDPSRSNKAWSATDIRAKVMDLVYDAIGQP